MSMTSVGRYEIQKELGRGAMAVVYKAVDPLIGRVVAIKTIRLESALPMEQKELRQRLHREAQSAGNLNHPNIVTIYDIGEQDDLSYIAMEFIEGETLESWMAAHPIPSVEQTISIIGQVASGLDYAAQRGVIHRDIKPGNILISADLRAKIADFGIAKISMSKFTQTGAIMGTPSYMSPEQAMGKDLDGRSDIFSLGVIFYEMLTGERPFAGTNPTTIIYKILHEEPVPPRKLNITVHAGLDSIVRKMLAKDPAQRFQSCGEVVQALGNYTTYGVEEGAANKTAPVDVPKKRGHTIPLLAAVLVVAVAAAGIYYYYYYYHYRQQQAIAIPAKTPPPAVPGNVPAATAAARKTTAAKPSVPVPDPTAQELKVQAAPPAQELKVQAEPPAAVENVAPKPKQNVVPPPVKKPVVEKILPAKLVVEYAGPEYPVDLLDGSRRLATVTAPGFSLEVPAGEHRFHMVSEEVHLDQSLEPVRLKPEETQTITVPGLGSAYIEVPNDAYDGCEILLNGRKLPTPYPALIQKISAGSHRLLFRWQAGKYAGKEVPFTLAIGEKHHYVAKGDPQTGQVTVQQIR